MKTRPNRNVCFARDRYYLQHGIREGIFKTNQAGAENQFKRGIMDLIVKHGGAIESTHISKPLADGTIQKTRHVLIRFPDQTTAAFPSPRAIYTNLAPFKYTAAKGEKIPEEWLPQDYTLA